MNASDADIPSTRPYLIRALHEWCTDCGFSPYLAVRVDGSVQVPLEYVNDHEIVLNVSHDATSGLELGNEYISFKARFGGVPRQVMVPVSHVLAIYARENGQGMGFPPPEASDRVDVSDRMREELGPDDSRLDSPSDDDVMSESVQEKAAPVLRAVPVPPGEDADDGSDDSPDDGGPTPTPPPSRPRLKLVK